MPEPIPPPLAAYIQSCLCAQTQTLITSLLGTQSPWLSLRCVYAAVHGVGDGEKRESDLMGTGAKQGLETRTVVFVSLLRPLSLWIDMGKKLGLDIPSLLQSKRIIYIDGLTYGASSTTASASVPPTTKLKSLASNHLRDCLNAALKTVSTSTSTSSIGTPTPPTPPTSASSNSALEIKPLILLDGMDFLLASQPSLSAIAIQSFLATLRTEAYALVLTCNADSPLMQTSTSPGGDTGTPLERNHAHFLTSAAHQSRWVLQLRGLDTGNAKDVTGVIRVSRGGDMGIEGYDGDDGKVQAALPDAEWLYQLRGDGSVRVWGRGDH